MRPSFITQAASQTNFVGLNTSFSVTATGASPLSYQWFFADTNIPGATGNVFTINNVQATNAGNYFVIVTNLYGSATSSVAVLTVNLSPYILTQPHSQTVNLSNNAMFTAVAGGEHR
ncbi:MAG: immunoglobulin domain-containing protein [Limisphaerales bacterium]